MSDGSQIKMPVTLVCHTIRLVRSDTEDGLGLGFRHVIDADDCRSTDELELS